MLQKWQQKPASLPPHTNHRPHARNWMAYVPPKVPLSVRDLDAHLMRGSFCQRESVPQMTVVFAQCTGVPNTQTTMMCMRCAPCPTTMISETNQLPNALKQKISKFCPQVNTSIQYLFGSVKLLEYCRVEAATEFVFISVHCVPIRNTCTAYTFMSACENVNSAN